MPGDTKRQEWNDMHKPLPEGGVRLHEPSLNVTQEHLQISITVRLLWGQRRTLEKGSEKK